jgi:hypothetical protein
VRTCQTELIEIQSDQQARSTSLSLVSLAVPWLGAVKEMQSMAIALKRLLMLQSFSMRQIINVPTPE